MSLNKALPIQSVVPVVTVRLQHLARSSVEEFLKFKIISIACSEGERGLLSLDGDVKVRQQRDVTVKYTFNSVL
jgi:hypothetical protein